MTALYEGRHHNATLAPEGATSSKRYTVKPGDTLAKIAAAHHVKGGWRALYQLNRGEVGGNPNLILPGQRLSL